MSEKKPRVLYYDSATIRVRGMTEFYYRYTLEVTKGLKEYGWRVLEEQKWASCGIETERDWTKDSEHFGICTDKAGAIEAGKLVFHNAIAQNL